MSLSGSGADLSSLFQSESGTQALVAVDPTGSATLRAEYVAHLNRRWRRLFGTVRTELRSNEALKPRGPAELAASIGEFDHVLESAIDEFIIAPLRPRAVTRGHHYSAQYVRKAYKHGLKLADAVLSQLGVDGASPEHDLDTRYGRVIRREPHIEPLHRYYRKAYDKIAKAGHLAHEDAAETYATKLDREATLAETISDSRTTHDGVNDRLRKMGKSATKLSALGIIVETINRAAIERYAQVDIESVGVVIEGESQSEDDGESPRARANVTQPAPGDEGFQIWSSAGDLRVCDTCASMTGSVYRIKEIRSGDAPMPVRDTHLGCRCYMIPHIEGHQFEELMGL